MEETSLLALEALVFQIQKRIAHEPSFKTILYKILFTCKNAKAFSVLEQEVLAYPEMKLPLQTPQVLLSWLKECEAICECVQEDASSLWQTTQAGECALEEEMKEDRIESLFVNDAHYTPVYKKVLEFCKVGKSRMEIESHLAQHPLLENPKIYASYFIDALEKAGGLVWESHWKTTQKAYAKL